ncbi:hypothetical protein ZWY2020_037027 [Hordeum vulgare]|nr:hypothetical protein ZWY2020_037027 [Hordeum vulgare]
MLGGEHCSLQLSRHSPARPVLQASQYRVVQALMHELLTASLHSSQLPVQFLSALQNADTWVLQELQERSTASQASLHFKVTKP